MAGAIWGASSFAVQAHIAATPGIAYRSSVRASTSAVCLSAKEIVLLQIKVLIRHTYS